MSELRTRRSDIRRAYIGEHPWAFCIALGAFVAGVLLAVLPLENEAALFVYLPEWAERVWAVSTATAGALVVVGMYRLRPPIEAAGLVLLAGTLFVGVAALVGERGAAAALVQYVVPTAAAGAVVRALLIESRARARR